ncbi:MAG TPA: DUF5302 domain-containing protein [Actinomadura sp.]|jgi:hypothetical protein|nr:DUF5302 domain-containing protein [Actinomadura sp.]
MAPNEAESTHPDDAKEKFREALERKRAQQAAKGAKDQGKGSSGTVDAHGPAQNRRQFRRKSG